MPIASTPTMRRTLVRDAAAMPISVTISCVESPVTGVVRSYGIARTDLHLGDDGVLPLDDPRRDVLREVLDQEGIVGDDAFDRLLEELREARHVHALLRRVEIDGAVDRRRDQLLLGAAADAHRLLDAGDAGARQADRHLGRGGLEVDRHLPRRFRHADTVPQSPCLPILPLPGSSRWRAMTCEPRSPRCTDS